MPDTVTITLDIAPSLDSGPPTELRIFPKGRFKTKKGEFLFDEKSAETVMAEYLEHGTDKHFDYWHDSVNPNMPGHARLAAAWHKLEVRDGELWATDIRWTPPAEQQVRNKQFRYLSPAFSVEPGESRRVVELVSTSLVNLPATRNLRPLVAASADISAERMPMANTIAVALGMNPDAPETEVLARLSRDREVVTELCKLSGKDNARDAIGVALAWKAEADAHEATRAELARLQAERDAGVMLAAIDGAIEQGRVAPAEREDLIGFGAKFGKDALTASLAARKQIVKLAHNAKAALAPADRPESDAATLPVDVLDACEAFGVTADEAKTTYAQMRKLGLPAVKEG